MTRIDTNPQRRVLPPADAPEAIHAVQRVTATMTAALRGLSLRDQNLALLSLHDLIADHLEALSTSTDD